MYARPGPVRRSAPHAAGEPYLLASSTVIRDSAGVVYARIMAGLLELGPKRPSTQSRQKSLNRFDASAV
jgi:hypothetical protein